MRGLIGGMSAAVLLFGSCVTGVALQPPPASAECGAPVVLDGAGLPVGEVAGYDAEQLSNAAAIINAGGALGVPARAQLIAVMTAMGESGLRVLDYGDGVGPDSRGLFQQRDNGAWGSYADRMDPTTSATNFYRALLAIDGWDSLAPTLAAHKTQRNADPYHYERYWPAALEVVAALAGTTNVPAADAACVTAPPADLPAAGWVRPAAGPITSPYGWRIHPITGLRKLHRGTDIGAPCGDPIYAAGPGVVVRAGPAANYGTLVVVDHGGGVLTRYAHMWNDGVLATVGAPVAGGAVIGLVGSNGDSTGCHLHFEVEGGGETVDPNVALSAMGVVL
ncbi:M23 family metallopeptidase [Jannaschia sp. R86511]|uniref:M23 family metallopeptidase n=1 Tax=Jannaschia sp. R86511 TaxID=3093853 RepID=UPI0036D361FD